MLTSQEIYNFLVTADNVVPDMGIPPPEQAGPDLPPNPASLPPSLPIDDGHVEMLRSRLLALIGSQVKMGSSIKNDLQVDRVFGNTPGESDPDSEPLDPEWEDILRMITEDSGDGPDKYTPTVSVRAKHLI